MGIELLNEGYGTDADGDKRGCDKRLVAASFFRINGVLLPTPRAQVTIFIKHEKLFVEIVPCASELNGRLTTSDSRCSRDSLSAIRHDFEKYGKLFFKIASYRSRLNVSFTTSDSRCSRSNFFENKPKFHKNLRSNFRKFLLIS